MHHLTTLRNLVFMVVFPTTLIFSPIVLPAQNDSVFISGSDRNSVIRGKITASSPLGITIKTNSTEQDVPASQILKIKYATEPSQLDRARERFDSGRYDDCISELDKIKNEELTPLVKTEVDFLRAFATAQKALRGDTGVTSQQAGSIINQFVKNNSNSYRLIPATEMLGRLLIAIGKPEMAEEEFVKLTQSNWNEYVLKGHYLTGQAQILQGKLDPAKASFDAIKGVTSNDDMTQQYKLLAECQLAKIMALQGQVEPAIEILNKIIKDEDADNTQLFANAYNALGTCYLKADQLKAASRAFLKTQLLFSAQADAHAEALFNLATIWPKLDQTDRANQARQALKSQYRNSYWASKL